MLNHILIAGNVVCAPILSYKSCIAGNATIVPATNNTISRINCAMFGIKIPLNVLLILSESSRYFTA